MVAVSVTRQSLRHAARSLRRDFGVTAMVLVSFAVGIGANVATFAVIDRVLFQPPAGVRASASVARLLSRERVWSGPEFVNDLFSWADWRDFAAVADPVARIEGYQTSLPLRLDDTRRLITLGQATPEFLKMLGVTAIRGRLFAENNVPGGYQRTVVITHELWQAAFASDPMIVGRRIVIDTVGFTVIGVTAPGFAGIDLDRVDAWTVRDPAAHRTESSGDRSLRLIARFRNANIEHDLARRLTQRYRDNHRHDSWFDATATVFNAPLLEARGPDQLRPTTARSLSFAERLFGIAIVVLAVSVANVASLLLMRTIRRRRDIAVRMALGSSRRRLVAELLAETAILATIASVVAGIVGAWGGSVLQTMLLFDIRWSVGPFTARPLMISFGLALSMTVAAGLAPIIVVRQTDLMSVIKWSGGRGPTGTRLRAGLIGVQTALCLVLLGFAGAFLQSLRRSSADGPGFDADNLITIDLTGRRTSQGDVQDLASRLRELPDVVSVAGASSDIRPGTQRGRVSLQDRPELPAHITPSFSAIDGEYFDAAGFKLIRGRAITSASSPSSAPIVVINESMGKMFWPDKDPIGQCVYAFGDRTTCRAVAGIVADVRWNAADIAGPHFLLPLNQTRLQPALNLIVRTRSQASAATVAQIETVVESTLGRQSRTRAQRVTDRLAPYTKPWRAAGILFAVFGCLALASTAIGLFGLISYDVAQRMPEFGVRRALGANARSLVMMVIGSSARAVACGLAAGGFLALLSGRVLGSYLYETTTHDPLLLLSAALVMVLSAIAASSVPAWRATKVDPATALRAE
jgi:predicted permease